MPVFVTVTTDQSAMAEFLYGARGAMVPLVTLWGEEIRTVSMRMAPRRSGLLANSHTVRVGIVPGFAFATISANTHYAYYVNRGTGIHGPRGRIIKARKGKVFRFEGSPSHGPQRAGGSAQGGGVVFARSTKGSPANPHLENALHAVMDGVPNVRYRRFRR